MSQSNSSSSGHPFVDNTTRTCFCGLLVTEHISRQPPSHGLRFICCPKKIEEQCLFFEWVDNPFCMICARAISSLQESIRSNESMLNVMEERIVDLIVSERLLQLRVQELEKTNLGLESNVAEHCESERLMEMRVQDGENTILGLESKVAEYCESDMLLQLRVQEQEKTILELESHVAEYRNRAEAAELVISIARVRLKLTAFVAMFLFIVVLSIVMSRMQKVVPSSSFQLGF